MLIGQQAAMDLNVHIIVLDANQKQVKDLHFKNTATERMTRGIAMFLAGDAATYENRTKLDSPASGLGRWRPNFVSFGTTGIIQQPTVAGGSCVVAENFADKNPPEGDRTRPWFYSKYLGERTAPNLWDPEVGWGPSSNTYQGELATRPDLADEKKVIRRHPILRAEVTTDDSHHRQVAKEGYSNDCILYGFTSVLWSKNFFTPSVPRIAISEFGLYETDVDEGIDTLMAGFRVPSESDIVYVEPGYVILVEWRITVRALMPYESVGNGGEPVEVASSFSVGTFVTDAHNMEFYVLVDGETPQETTYQWTVSGEDDPEEPTPIAAGTSITPSASTTSADLVIDANEENQVLMIRVVDAGNEDNFVRFPVFVQQTQVVTDVTEWSTASSIVPTNIALRDLTFDVQGTIYYSHNGSEAIIWSTYTEGGTNWELSGQTSQNTSLTLIPTASEHYLARIQIGFDEIGTNGCLTVAATDTHSQRRLTNLIPIINHLAMDYTVSDFSNM